MGEKKAAHGSAGKMPAKGGRGGSRVPSDMAGRHGSIQQHPSGGNKNQLDMNSPACGKAHTYDGGKSKYNSPKPKCYAQGPQGKQSGGY